MKVLCSNNLMPRPLIYQLLSTASTDGHREQLAMQPLVSLIDKLTSTGDECQQIFRLKYLEYSNYT